MFIEIVIFDVNTTIARIRRNIMKGQGLVEYALILVLVAVIAIAILAILGPAIGNMFSVIVSNL
jgi:pilus assembly protein Flp/PilA